MNIIEAFSYNVQRQVAINYFEYYLYSTRLKIEFSEFKKLISNSILALT